MMFTAFTSWAALEKIPWQSRNMLDRALAQYFDHLFLDGEPASLGSQIIAAAGHFIPSAGRHGPDRPSCGAGMAQTGSSSLALPLDLASAFEHHWVGALSRRHRDFALFLLLTFEMYLRPSESLRMLATQLVPPLRSQRVEHPWGVILEPAEPNRASKVHEFDEAVSWDKPSLSWAAGAFAELSQRDPTTPLWVVSHSQALKMLKKAAYELDLPYQGMSLYMLRHGGASNDALMKTRTIEHIKQRGRWLSDRSVKRYQKSTRAQQLAAAMHPETLQYADLAEASLPEYIMQTRAAPPPPAVRAPLRGDSTRC